MDAEERALLRAELQTCPILGDGDRLIPPCLKALDALEAAEAEAARLRVRIRDLYERADFGLDMQDVAWARYDRACAERDDARAEASRLTEAVKRYFAALDTLDCELDDDAVEAGEQFAARIAEFHAAGNELRAALAATESERQ